ncbi:MAG: family 20 glycosylhydrolase [Victivallales bacterium]|jgi:hexosaminidase
MTFSQGIRSIIPVPSRIRPRTGRFILKPQLKISICEKELSPIAERFAEDLAVVTRKAASAIVSDCRKTDSAEISLRINRKLEEEEYSLDITPDAIRLGGGSSLAVAWGLSTLLQSTVVHHVDRFIPCAHIADKPRFSYRGLMVDVARHPHSLLTLKKLVTLCSFYKIRYMQLHLSDVQAFTFPSRAYPNLATPHNHLSIDAWRELEEYAASCGVVIIPELDVPGHANKELKNLCPTDPRSGHTVINPVSENTFKVLDALVGEILDVFPRTSFFHIGADEVDFNGWAQCRDCATFLKKHGLKDIRECYRHFISRMNGIVRSHGRRMIVWEGFAAKGVIPIPKNIITQFFDVEYLQPEEVVSLGHDIINSSWGPLYVVSPYASCTLATVHKWHPELFGGNAMSSVPEALDNAPAFGTVRRPVEFFREELPGRTYPFAKAVPSGEKLLGAMMCSWELIDADEIPSLRRRLPAMSDKSWNPSQDSSFSDFLLRLETQDYRLDGLLHDLTLRHRSVLPDFGPTGPEYLPFINDLLVSKPQKCDQPVKFAYPRSVSRMGFRRRRFSGDFCDLHAEMKSSPDSVFYFVHRFRCGKQTRFTALLGYDGPAVMWVNGKKVFADFAGANPALRDEEEIPFAAKAGENEIMVALHADGGKAWGIYLRLKRLTPR